MVRLHLTVRPFPTLRRLRRARRRQDGVRAGKQRLRNGARYAHWTVNLSLDLLTGEVRPSAPAFALDSYTSRRILPSKVVHYLLLLLGVPVNGANIIAAFAR